LDDPCHPPGRFFTFRPAGSCSPRTPDPQTPARISRRILPAHAHVGDLFASGNRTFTHVKPLALRNRAEAPRRKDTGCCAFSCMLLVAGRADGFPLLSQVASRDVVIANFHVGQGCAPSPGPLLPQKTARWLLPATKRPPHESPRVRFCRRRWRDPRTRLSHVGDPSVSPLGKGREGGVARCGSLLCVGLVGRLRTHELAPGPVSSLRRRTAVGEPAERARRPTTFLAVRPVRRAPIPYPLQPGDTSKLLHIRRTDWRRGSGHARRSKEIQRPHRRCSLSSPNGLGSP